MCCVCALPRIVQADPCRLRGAAYTGRCLYTAYTLPIHCLYTAGRGATRRGRGRHSGRRIRLRTARMIKRRRSSVEKKSVDQHATNPKTPTRTQHEHKQEHNWIGEPAVHPTRGRGSESTVTVTARPQHSPSPAQSQLSHSTVTAQSVPAAQLGTDASRPDAAAAAPAPGAPQRHAAAVPSVRTAKAAARVAHGHRAEPPVHAGDG